MPKCKYKYKGDICFTCPGRKNPVAYGTRANSDLLALIAQSVANQNESITPNNMLKYINKLNLIAYEERKILEKYIELGCGDKELIFV